MPSRGRQDIRPEILLPDVRDQERRANAAIDNRHRAKVRHVDHRPVTDGWTNIFDRTDEILSFIRRNRGNVDEALVFFMMRNCEKASASPVKDANNEPLVREGKIVHRLMRVGCRVYMTQEQIADKFGNERTTINGKIGEMRKHGLIVNQGHGWYEFDANLCWRGDFNIQKAYREIQRVRDGWIITDGVITHVTEDMDDDDEVGNEHTPPRCAG